MIDLAIELLNLSARDVLEDLVYCNFKVIYHNRGLSIYAKKKENIALFR